MTSILCDRRHWEDQADDSESDQVWIVCGEDETEVGQKGSSTPLECRYEFNCTQLYKRIEHQDWYDVANFLDTGCWDQVFFPEGDSPAKQARTWVTRMEEPKSSRYRKFRTVPKIMWSQLPLHLAILLNAPFGIIRRLVYLYPASVRCTNDQTMLPIHIALQCDAPDAVLDFLFEAFPEGIKVRGKRNMAAAELAARPEAVINVIARWLQETDSQSTD